MNKITIILNIILILCTIVGHAKNINGIYTNETGCISIDIKNDTVIILHRGGPGIGTYQTAKCTIEKVSDSYYIMKSLEYPLHRLLKRTDIVTEDYTDSDSCLIIIKTPTYLTPLNVEIATNSSYTKSTIINGYCTVKIPYNKDEEIIVTLINPLNIVSIEPDGSFHGFLWYPFYVSNITTPKKYIFTIQELDTDFFTIEYINGDLIQISNRKLFWRGQSLQKVNIPNNNAIWDREHVNE